MKTCSKCKQEKPLSEFHTRIRRGSEYIYPSCVECHRAIMRAHYEANRQAYLDKAAVRGRIAYAAARDYVRCYLLTHPCIDCGEPDLVVLQFDHCRGVKKDSIAHMVRSGPAIKTLEAESAKCDVVCANCHARRTAARGGWWSLALIAQRTEQPATNRQVGSSSLSEGALA